jgi:L-2-hydroxyglutarate oxidase
MYDFAVIGGGIIGLSVAWQLRQRQPSKSVVVIEKEQAVARHQTGHNSGVIHAGIYYEPGSLKAELCRKGVSATIRFCTDNAIPFEQCGKLIVATNQAELERMHALHHRALQNGIEVELLNETQLKAAEPNPPPALLITPRLRKPWRGGLGNSAERSLPARRSFPSKSPPMQ